MKNMSQLGYNTLALMIRKTKFLDEYGVFSMEI